MHQVKPPQYGTYELFLLFEPKFDLSTVLFEPKLLKTSVSCFSYRASLRCKIYTERAEYNPQPDPHLAFDTYGWNKCHPYSRIASCMPHVVLINILLLPFFICILGAFRKLTIIAQIIGQFVNYFSEFEIFDESLKNCIVSKMDTYNVACNSPGRIVITTVIYRYDIVLPKSYDYFQAL